MRRVSAILLAAGRSQRMGRLKGLLPWQGTSLIEWQLTQLEQSLIDDIVVVLGYGANRYEPLIQRHQIRSVINNDYEQGKTSSILKGLKTISPQAEAVLIAAVDQPLRERTINHMIKHMVHTNQAIVIPIYGNQRGHPVLFSASLKGELLRISEQTHGLKNIIRTHHELISELHTDDAYVLYNFNRPSDYLRVRTHNIPQHNERKGGYECV